jgi:hypothetical protein
VAGGLGAAAFVVVLMRKGRTDFVGKEIEPRALDRVDDLERSLLSDGKGIVVGIGVRGRAGSGLERDA